MWASRLVTLSASLVTSSRTDVKPVRNSLTEESTSESLFMRFPSKALTWCCMEVVRLVALALICCIWSCIISKFLSILELKSS